MADLVTECPVVLQFFHHYVRIDEIVFTSPAGTDRETRTIIYTRDGDGFCDYTDDTVHDPVFAGSLGIFVSSTSTWSGGVYAHSETWTNGTSTTSIVFSDPETEATLTATVRGLMAAADWAAGTCVSKKDYQHRAVAPCDESEQTKAGKQHRVGIGFWNRSHASAPNEEVIVAAIGRIGNEEEIIGSRVDACRYKVPD